MDDQDKFELARGPYWVRGAINPNVISELRLAVGPTSKPGLRNIEIAPAVRARLETLAQSIKPGARLISATAFSKGKTKAWSLPWHQDRVIPLPKGVDPKRFTRQSTKASRLYGEPPPDWFDRLFFGVLLLDDVGPDNGPTEIVLRATPWQPLSREALAQSIAEKRTAVITGKPGDLIFMEFLTPHRSTKPVSSNPRRQIRLDFSVE